MNKLLGALLVLALLGVAVAPGIASAQEWTYVYYAFSSDSIYTFLYVVQNGVPVAFPGSVKLYIDNNYIGTYSVGTSGTWIWIPQAYKTPGTHTFTLSFEGDETHLPAQASGSYYIQGEQSGGTTSFDKTHIIINNTAGTSQIQEFVTNISDFNGYWLSWYNVTWINYREWWEFGTANDLYIRLNISTSSGKTALVVTRLHGATEFFGAMNTLHTSVGASCEADSWDLVTLTVPPFYTYGFEVTGWNPEEFKLFVIPESSQTKVIWIWEIGGKTVSYTQTLDVVLDGPAIIALTYEQSGKGYVEGYIADSFSLPPIPYAEEFKSGVVGWINEVVGIDLGFAVQILLSIVVLFVSVARLSFPLLGLIVFLWIMDTMYTAITTGEVRLIGDMFLRIYEVLMAIWRTLVGIIETVWDLITFWS